MAGSNLALGPVDFEIKAGEFVSIIGASGCGKSTLMLITAGLIPPSTGAIIADGEPLTKPLTDVGIVFQDHLLLDFRTAMNNVLLQQEIRGLDRNRVRRQSQRAFQEARSGGSRGPLSEPALRRHAPARIDSARPCA